MPTNMSQFGRLEEFDCSSNVVDSYFERLHSFYRANEVRDGAKVDIFLSVVGSKTYKLLKSLLAPALPSSKSIDELQELLKKACTTYRLSHFAQIKVLYKKTEGHRKCFRFRCRTKASGGRL